MNENPEPGYVIDTADGKPRLATKAELREDNRLLAKHRDIVRGNPRLDVAPIQADAPTVEEVVADGVVRCAICLAPGESYCTDTIACNFRARRRLGMPYFACVEWRARDLERLASVDHAFAQLLRERPLPERNSEYREHLGSAWWQQFADAQRLLARYRCEWCGQIDVAVSLHHLTYDRLGAELPTDVLVVCPIHHRELDEERRQRGRVPVIEITVTQTRREVVWTGRWGQVGRPRSKSARVP